MARETFTPKVVNPFVRNNVRVVGAGSPTLVFAHGFGSDQTAWRHHEAVLANLRTNGFGVVLASHAFSAIDAYVYGFVLTELNLPFDAEEGAAGFVEEIRDALGPERYPHLVAMIAEQVEGGGYDYGDEFGFGLDLVLDGLERHLDQQPGR